MRKKISAFMILFLIIILPIHVFAEDFSITDVKIEAYLQENGDVYVSEVHSYSFDSSFNGITREIFPKTGVEIRDFIAKEDEKTLKVEKEEHLYKVYRSGKKEDIIVNLQYTIKNALEKHADMTEFYWPFFDDRNETTYEQMDITIHPPKQTNDVIAFGYDEAFDKQMIRRDGTVQYHLGEVPSGKNGDIRVAYNSELFPLLSTLSNTNIKSQILDEKTSIEEKAKKFIENKEKVFSLGKVILSSATIALIVLLLTKIMFVRRKQILVNDEITKKREIVPDQRISMPATILLTKTLTSNSIAAALLDLVRKGFVEQLTDHRFKLVNQNVKLKHEGILLNWLFNDIGTKGEFHSEALNDYVDNEKNLSSYHSFLTNWQQAVKEEIKTAEIYERKTMIKVYFGVFSAIFITFLFIFAYYELFLFMFLSILFSMIGLGMTLFYKPISRKGLLIKREWQKLLTYIKDEIDWKAMTEDARKRALIFELGTTGETIKEYSRDAGHSQNNVEGFDQSFLTFYFLTGPMLSSSFHRADERYMQSQASDSNSSYSSSGGGVGGGGGGSGAF